MKKLILISFLLLVTYGYSQTTQTFSTSGTFYVPAGVTNGTVQVWGAGGAGGGNTTTADGAGGGGGGAYSSTTGTFSFTQYTITVGTGGMAVAGGIGGDGGDSSFSTSVIAKGGSGGNPPVSGNGGVGGAGGSAAASIGATKYDGGNGGRGRNHNTGHAGPGGTSAGTGSNGLSGATTWSTINAPTPVPTGAGAGAAGGSATNNGADNISNPGGGGGGGGDKNASGSASTIGGNGADGQVIVTWICPAAYALTVAASNNGPLCNASAAIVTLRSGSMPSGNYNVTYNLSGATSATGNTATMTFTAGSPGTGTFTTPTLNVGSTTVTITNLSSGAGCSSVIGSFNTTNVSVIAPATAVAGTNVAGCSTSSSFNITAGSNATNFSSYVWSTPNGTGSFTNANSLTLCTYTPSVADIAAGTRIMTLTVTGNSPCGSVSSSKFLTISDQPVATPGPTVTTCSAAGAVNITTGSSAMNHSSVTWTSSGTGTFANPNSLSTCTYTPSAADITAGSITLTLTANSAFCSSVSATKTLNILNSPTITSTTPGSRFGNGTVALAAAASSGTIYWYANPTGGGALGSGNSFTTPFITTTTTYYIDCFNGICYSAPRVAVTATLLVNEIDVQGNSISIIDGDFSPSTADWTDFSTTISTRTFTILNTGNHILNLGAITLSGSNPGDFAITTAPVSPVAAGSSTTFVVTFTPSAIGTRSADISIVNDDSNENPYDFRIQGTGVAQEINIQGNGISIADGDITPTLADSTNFGTSVVNTGTTSTYTIQNLGSVNLTLGAITFTGANPGDFTVTTAPSAIVSGYGSTTIVVTFTPSASGTRSATMSIVNNDSNENPYDFRIQGTGIEPEMDVQGNAISILDGDTTPSIADATDFGVSDINTGSVTKTFTIYNTGTSILNIGAITFSGVNPSDFSISTAPNTTVALASSTTFIVTFDPGAPGIRTAIMNIANDDVDENPYNFTLQGFGTAQEMDVLGNAISIADGDTTPTTADWTDFSNITTTRTFTINNIGTSPLTIGAITFSGPNAADFSISSAPSNIIIAGSSSTFTVQFSPLGIGTSTATISIVNNDLDENPYDFNLQGTAINNEINIQGNGVNIVDGDTTPTTADWTDFSTVATSRTFTIQNTGATPLTIGAITFSGTNAADFSILTPPNASISGYSSGTFVVRFTPTSTGVKTATMSIVNNDTDENPYDFALRGTGVAQEINIQGNATNIVTGDLSPTTADWTDFSNVAITRTFTIQNTGTMDLNIGTMTIIGANPGDFSITTFPSSIVAGTTSSTFIITFSPIVVGTRTATVRIPNNDSNENPYTFGISATSASEINVSGLFTNIVDGDSTPSQTDWTDFGTVSIENGNVLANYTIRNSGTGPLVIGAITIAGVDAGDFTVTGVPSASIAAGASSILQVSFKPLILGTKNATISIANNDIDENPFNFSITGVGVRTYIDTDGDGVTDNFDLDDDNDGIVDTLEQSTCVASPFASSIVQTFLNETFGSGTTRGQINVNIPGASTTSCYEDGITSNANNCASNSSGRLDDGEYCVNYFISHNSDASYPESVHLSLAWTDQLDHTPGDTNGRMAIYNADNTAGTYFYQALINGVIPNAPISFGFWVMNIMRQGNLGGTIRPNITVEFRDITGATLFTSFTTGDIGRCSASDPTDNTCGPSLSNWLNYATTVNLGNVTDFMVKIRNNAPGGGGNDFAMDDILITQTYCDWDGDGIANLFDLDSDNDGIPDIEEGGFKQYSGGLSRMNLAGTWTDANLNGMNDVIDPIYTGVNNSVPDTDGDGARDYIDLDSDNDGQFDVDEAIANMGDGDINGDGKGDGVDTDKDGILDIYDTLVGFGTGVKPFTQNSDGIGNPDYLQVDSNNDGITDIAASLYASLDANNDGKIDGAADIDRDGILDAFDTNTAAIGSPRDLNRKLFLDFDGRNDYGQDATALGVLPNASIMAWIDLNDAFTTTGVIAAAGSNFQLRVNNIRKLEVVVNGSTVSYNPVALNKSQWYHVGAVYNGSTVKLYLNGVMVASGAATGSIASSVLTLGKNPSAANSFFKGKIDELRVFNVALTDAQLQRMIYQEIENNASQVRGAIVPKDIESLPYANILRYYRMDAYKDDIVDNLITPTIDTGSGMKIFNHKVIKVQEAPMPFVTRSTGTFATAINDATKDIRGLDATDYDYSIIQVKHNITETANTVDLAMFVDPGVTITMNNDTKIQNDWYLKLDGKIDLQGKSQLVQTTNSDLDATSAGSIERDQQGQSNKFNYNYWSSPVGALSATTNNNPFTVNGVLRDGTDPNNIQNITWTTGYNGAATSPITLSSYWIFKFQNLTPQYANWAAVGQNGTLQPAQGYTMKGTDAATSTQNYTFVGKPNNGTITTPIAAGNLNLCGNPYASAIDADAFIASNIGSTTGAVYFWEHYSTNTSHNLIDYQGGYAARNLVGGTPPVAPAGISGMGTSARVPARFIPVGQGFLVYGNATGGNVTFNNGQRGFVKETDATSNVLFRQNSSISVIDRNFDNTEDRVLENNTFTKIRLGFNSVNNYHRQILLGFMNEFATEGFDLGYDAPQLDVQPNDFYFKLPAANLVIQGVDAFNSNKILPLSVKNATEGNVSFTLDETENFDENQNIYIHDNVTNEYHDIRNNNFEINLPVGTFDTRFSLRFTNAAALGTNDFELSEEVIVSFTNNDNMININNRSDASIKSVELYNILGQAIKTWDVKNSNQSKIQIPVMNISTGAYIVKVLTTKGDLSKKIIIE